MDIVPPALALARPAGAVGARSRLGGALRDALDLFPPLLGAAVLATAWLLVCTAWGRDDASDAESAVALAILAGAPAAWVARAGLRLIATGATPGLAAAGLRIQAAHTARYGTWLAVHPLFGTAVWAWLALAAVLAAAFEAAIALGVIAAAVALAGVVSAIVLLAGGLPLHDRLAGVRCVAP